MVQPGKAGNYPPKKVIGPFSFCLDDVLYSG